jgi:hypothetical protein
MAWVNQTKTTFLPEEMAFLIASYIDTNRNIIFPTGDMSSYYVDKTHLGIALGMFAFEASMIVPLLSTLLRHAHPYNEAVNIKALRDFHTAFYDSLRRFFPNQAIKTPDNALISIPTIVSNTAASSTVTPAATNYPTPGIIKAIQQPFPHKNSYILTCPPSQILIHLPKEVVPSPLKSNPDPRVHRPIDDRPIPRFGDPDPWPRETSVPRNHHTLRYAHRIRPNSTRRSIRLREHNPATYSCRHCGNSQLKMVQRNHMPRALCCQRCGRLTRFRTNLAN